MNKEKRATIIAYIGIIAVVLVITVAAGAFIASAVHKCDECEATFYGSGYYKEKDSEGVVGSLIGSLLGGSQAVPLETVEGVVICRNCAENNISVQTYLRDVDDFKR